jgi:6-phosphogluconolactonase
MMKFLFSLIFFALFLNESSAAEIPFYIGTYTNNPMSKGIYLGHLDSDTGKLGPLTLAGEASNPGFLVLSTNHKFLYAAMESNGKSVVGAFAVKSPGALTALNQKPSGGEEACHISIDGTGHYLLVANYGGGNIACFQIKQDGSIGERTAFVQFTGSGPNRDRQEKAHAHSIYTDPEDKFVYSCDLGSDSVWTFKFDAGKGTLTPNNPPAGKVPPGGGPRHLAFHPNGRFVYVVDEMGPGVTLFSRDLASGTLTPLKTFPSLPKEISTQGITVAEIACDPSGRWLYVSNRGCDTLSVFAIASDGSLSLIQSTPSVVQFPRNFALDPTGHWLIAAGQKGNQIAVFRIDPATGRLTPTDQTAKIGSPVCILF